MNPKIKDVCMVAFMTMFSLDSLAMDAKESKQFITYKNQGQKPKAKLEQFAALDIRVGTVTTAELNRKAKVPSLRIVMDFGPSFSDLKQSSAQLRDNYCATDEERSSTDKKMPLMNRQIAAVTNFPKRSVGIPSFFLTLGVVSLEGEETGTVVIQPLLPVKNGSKVILLNGPVDLKDSSRSKQVKYEETFDALDIRAGTVLSLEAKTIDFGPELGTFVYEGNYPLLKEGIQILRAMNLLGMEQEDNLLGLFNEQGAIPLILERPLPNGRFLK